MPRWRALPDELDPQVREFASQLRRLVDRSGLSIAAVADRTGYSKTSWDRYLNGKLLAPKGAIIALAEVTGTSPVHLTTMWELAERAWSRSEMRHDMTMEAIRVSQARAALGEFGAPPAPATPAKGGKAGRKGGSVTATPGIAGPARCPRRCRHSRRRPTATYGKALRRTYGKVRRRPPTRGGSPGIQGRGSPVAGVVAAPGSERRAGRPSPRRRSRTANRRSRRDPGRPTGWAVPSGGL